MIEFAEEPPEADTESIRFTAAERYAMQIMVRRTRGRSYQERRKLLLSVLNKIEKLAEREVPAAHP